MIVKFNLLVFHNTDRGNEIFQHISNALLTNNNISRTVVFTSPNEVHYRLPWQKNTIK